MKPRILILAGILEAALLLVGVYFEPTYSVRGHLRGEPFFAGQPISAWRHELIRWTFDGDVLGDPCSSYVLVLHRPATFLECIEARHWPFSGMVIQDEGPEVLRGDPEAVPVLLELLSDPSAEVRELARHGFDRARQLQRVGNK